MTAEWHEWRRNGIGASDVAAIIGISPWSGPYAVWALKTGRVAPTEPTEAMHIGAHAEDLIAVLTEQQLGQPVIDRQLQVEHRDEPWARCTIDGRLPDGTLIEMKTSGDPPWLDGVPSHYFCQVQWQMFVTGASRAIVSTLHANRGLQHRTYLVERDDKFIDVIADSCRRFWHDNVLADVPPPVDASRATSDIADAIEEDPDADAVDLTGNEDLIDRYLSLKQQANSLYSKAKALESEIKLLLGPATVGLLNGQRVVTWRTEERSTVSVKDLIAAAPDIAEQIIRKSATRVMRWTRSADE